MVGVQSALSLSDFAWLHNAVLLSVTVVLTFGMLAKCAVTVRLCLGLGCSIATASLALLIAVVFVRCSFLV